MRNRRRPPIVVGDVNTFRDLVVKRCGTAPAESPGLLEWARNQYVDAWAFLRSNEDGDTGMWNRNGCVMPNGGLLKRIDYVMARAFAKSSIDRWAMIESGSDARHPTMPGSSRR